MIADENIHSDLLDRKETFTILAVEDDFVSMEFLKAQVKSLNYTILTATNGQDALTILQTHHDKIDVVLMDREMPIMDGLTTVKRMKDNEKLRNIPVVMVTRSDSTDEMKEGLDAGVFYYLTKPTKEDVLQSVLSAALREVKQASTLAEELSKHKMSFDLIDTAKFKFQTVSEAENLSAFLANCFPHPNQVLLGLGELLINAIEHGNLGIGYERKTELVEAGTWRTEVDRLQKLSQNVDKYAVATIVHKPDGIYVVVEDEGNGFDWRNFLQIDPARAGDNHGRGIAQANIASFDQLTYNKKGNQAVASVGYNRQLEW